MTACVGSTLPFLFADAPAARCPKLVKRYITQILIQGLLQGTVLFQHRRLVHHAQKTRWLIATNHRQTLPLPAGAQRPDYRLASLGGVVAEVCDLVGAGRPVHLVGHSLGGLVARETALSKTTELLSLTLMCSGPGAFSGEGAARVRAVIAALADDPTPERLRELWEEHVERETAQRVADPEIREFLRERLLAGSPEGLLRLAENLLHADDRVAELAATGLATFVLYGENDDGWPLEQQDDMAARLGAERVVVPGAGHSPNVEAPETTSSALTAFWNKTESVGPR